MFFIVRELGHDISTSLLPLSQANESKVEKATATIIGNIGNNNNSNNNVRREARRAGGRAHNDTTPNEDNQNLTKTVELGEEFISCI